MKSVVPLVCATLAAASGLAAQELPTARIDSVFLEVKRSDRPGCTLGIYRGGEVAYANGYGMANLEYGIALEPRSVFHIASISKQFTAFAVELLVSQGLVSWDDPIQKYVPEIPEYEHPVTLRHLVHHTSGIRDQWNLLIMAGWRWEADLVTQENAIEIMSRQTALNFDPGEANLYSNSGFTLLAAVVERVAGQTLRQFAEERIFGPLGMTSTHFHDDHETIVPDRAYGYRHWDDEGWKISIPDFAIVGASSLFTTVEDLAKWDANLRDHRLGDDALYDRFFERGILASGDTLDYAHGIAVSPYRGHATVGHGGADAGYRTSYLRFPDLDIGIASFCNFARANPGRYVQQVADIVLEDVLDPVAEDEDEESPDVDVERWGDRFAGMVGFYRDPRRDIPVHIWLHEGAARIQPGMGDGASGVPITPSDDGGFTVAGEVPLEVSFEGERAVSLEVGGTRYEHIGPPVTDVDASDYVGTYWSEELGTEFRIEPGEGDAALVMVHRVQDARAFRPAYRDGFTTDGDWLSFERDAAGRVTGFSWSNGRVWRVRVDRRSG